MPDFSLNVTAGAVAWYAAIVSTVAAGISFHNAWRDRALVKITYQTSLILNAAQYDEKATYFTITVRNAGKRTVAIGNVGIRLYNNKVLLLTDSVMGRKNKVLSEEHPRTEFITKEDALPPRKYFYRIEVSDEAGRHYYKYFSQMPTARKVWHTCLKSVKKSKSKKGK